jgi:imidazolonepropionase-like amidohydrolase
MSMWLFTSGRVLDPVKGQLIDGLQVLVEGNRIKEVSDAPIRSASAETVDLRGKTLMPGLIDCHVHVAAALVDLKANALAPSSLTALRAARIMDAMLMRGFTTVRDASGADLGLVLAVEEGLIAGPRLVICGKALSQTGGHSDTRHRMDDRDTLFSERLGGLGRISDGVDAVRRAAREEIKAGARFIKIMANGGVASPNDPIHALGFSKEEIRAIVEEAGNAGTYVAAHLYTDQAIRRAVDCGVHSLEHCNLIEAETARLAAKAGSIAVPTLVAYEALAMEGAAFGLSADSAQKNERIRKAGIASLSIMKEAGLTMAFGTDLLGQLQRHQCMEFEILARVLSPAEIIASATVIGSRLCRMEGEVGVIAPNAFADLIVLDGDPFRDIGLLQADGAHMSAIMSSGKMVKNLLQ